MFELNSTPAGCTVSGLLTLEGNRISLCWLFVVNFESDRWSIAIDGREGHSRHDSCRERPGKKEENFCNHRYRLN